LKGGEFRHSPLFSPSPHHNIRIMKNLCAVVFLLTSSFVIGQTQEAETDSIDSVEPWTWANATKYVKFSPLDVFSVVPTFGIDYEVKMKNGSGLQAGIAGVPPTLQILAGEAFNGYDKMGGYKLRFEGRAYMPVKTNRYISAGLSFRHLIIRDVVAVGMEEVIGEFGQSTFAYFMNVPMVFNRFNTHFEFKYGFQKVIQNSVVIEMYMGLSLRSIRVQSNSEIPLGAGLPDQRGLWTLADGHKLTYPVPIFGFKFGFLAPSWMGGKK